MFGTSISSKGQVTIPKEIRSSLKLKPGDRVSFVFDGNKAILVPVKSDFWSLGGILHDYVKGKPLSAQDMDRKAKERVVKRYHAHRSGLRS